MENEDILKKRTDKVLHWLKNPYNFAFVAVLVFAFAIRLFYFILTQHQPLWWDEADYMNMTRRWAFGESYWIDPVRQVLFSFITAFFLKISDTEFLPRLFILILSFASVPAVYYLGKEIYDKKIGLIAALFMSVFYMNLFFSFRLINDIASLTFFTFSAFFFYKYFKSNSHKALYLAAVFIAIGTLFKLTTASLLFVVLIYLLTTEKLKFLKRKEIWIGLVIFFAILSPYIIWGYHEYNSFVIFTAQQEIQKGAPAPVIPLGTTVLIDYVKMLPQYLFLGFNQTSPLYWYLSLILIFGLLILYASKLFLGFDILLKENLEKTAELKRDFYIMLLIIVHSVLVSFLILHNEDRYILNSFPALFIIFGFFIMKVYGYFEKKKLKFIGILIIIALLLFFVSVQLRMSDSTIKGKINSYAEIRDAAYWVRDNSNKGDVILSESAFQMKYYSGREYYRFPATKEELETLIKEKHPRYYMLSAFERGPPPYVWTYPQEKNLTAAKIYFADPGQTQPLIIIYEFPKDFKVESENSNAQKTMDSIIPKNTSAFSFS